LNKSLAVFCSLGNNLGMTLTNLIQPSGPVDDFAGSQALGRRLAQHLANALDLPRKALHELPDATVLCKSGDRMTQLPYVMSGRLDVVVYVPSSSDGQIVPISFQAGEIAFLSYLFNHLPSGGDLIVREAAVIKWIEVAEMERVLLSDPSSLVLLVRFLGLRLREVQARERALSTRGVKSRIGAGLLRYAAAQSPRADGIVIIPLTHEQMASRCGVSRPKASIALKNMEQLGIIKLGRKWIQVLDVDALRMSST
jgi:CRP-like cAMP-binding protein